MELFFIFLFPSPLPPPFVFQQYKKIAIVPYGTIIIIIIVEVNMVTKINSGIHWKINKITPSKSVPVTLEQYEEFIKSHDVIYEIDSIHRDDTDFKTYTVIDNNSVLIGWADYYHMTFYIYK